MVHTATGSTMLSPRLNNCNWSTGFPKSKLASLMQNVARRRADMHKYQDAGVSFIKSEKKCGLFIDMGLGKTVISLTAISDLLFENEVSRVLVIAPKKVANNTWPNEFEEWSHLCYLGYSLASGTPDQRTKAVDTMAPITIVSRDNIKWLIELWESRRKWPYDMLVIDESSSFKDSSTARFKALKKIVKRLKYAVILTATPNAESYLGLWPQMYIVDQGAALGRSMTQYKDQYFKENSYSREINLIPGADRIIQKRVAKKVLVMEAADYLPEIPCEMLPIEIEIPKAVGKKYAAMEKDMVISLDTGSDEIEISADSAATLAGKLLQMASGVIYNTYDVADVIDGEEVVYRQRDVYELHDEKYQMLDDIIEHNTEGPLLVAYYFKSTLERLKKRYPKATVMDKDGKCIKDWNAGKIKLLFAHPMSAGHGLNMQKSGHILIYFDIPASLECYYQMIGRIRRQGQKNTVRVMHFISYYYDDKGKKVYTKDQDTFDALKRKENVMDVFKKMVKKLRNKYGQNNKTS